MLMHYLDLLRQYWKTIIVVSLAAGALTCAASIVLLRTMPQYQSSVTMNMEPSEEALRFNRAFLGVSQFNPATIITQTHIERLLSRRVAERALDILIAQGSGALEPDPPDAFDRLKSALWQNWARLNYGYFTPASEREQMVNDLMEASDVKAVLGSYILMLEVTYDDPDMSTRIANALARAYTEIASEDFAAEAARVDSALAELQAEKEAELSRYMERRRALDRELGFESVEDGRAILLAERTQARQALAAARGQLQALRLELESGGEAEAAAREALRAELSDGETRVAQRSEALEAVEAELQALDRTETRLTEIDQKIVEAENDLAELQRQRITTELARKARLNQVSVISEAVAPTYPVFPKVLVNTVAATILAALLAIAPVALLDVLDDRVRTHEDLRQAVGGRALPSVSRRLVAQARRFRRRGRRPGRRLRRFAEAMGRRFVTEGPRHWPDKTIYVTAIGTPDDATRLGGVIEAAVQFVAQNRRDGGDPPKVVALPEMSRLSDLATYRDGTLLIGVAAGQSDRAEVARLGSAASDSDADTVPFLTVLM